MCIIDFSLCTIEIFLKKKNKKKQNRKLITFEHIIYKSIYLLLFTCRLISFSFVFAATFCQCFHLFQWQFMRFTIERGKYNFHFILITARTSGKSSIKCLLWCNLQFRLLGQHFWKGQRILASICLWPYCCCCCYWGYCDDLSAAPAATGNCLKMPNAPPNSNNNNNTAQRSSDTETQQHFPFSSFRLQFWPVISLLVMHFAHTHTSTHPHTLTAKKATTKTTTTSREKKLTSTQTQTKRNSSDL